MKVLFIATRIPQLDGKGDELVSYYRILSLLRYGHSVALTCLLLTRPTQRDLFSIDQLRAMDVRLQWRRVSYIEQILGAIFQFLFGSLPLQAAIYHSTRSQGFINKSIADFEPDIVYLFLIRAASNCVFSSPPLAVDFVDSISLNYSRAAPNLPWYKRFFYEIESNRCYRLERKLAAVSRISFAVSLVDASHICPRSVVFIPNGVDSSRYTPSSSGFPSKPRLVFTGNMGYQPNIDAVRWFCNNCWLSILSLYPDAELFICGSDPTHDVLGLMNDFPSVFVTGRVASIAAELNASSLAIAPMRSGAGMQNKILEAMSCGLPVVVTSLGLGSIQAQSGVELLLADNPEEYVSCVDSLLSDGRLARSVSCRARAFVVLNHDWNAIGQAFVESLQSACVSGAPAAAGRYHLRGVNPDARLPFSN
jgi:glycosyltransferase involved in cell wall biosynthesis